MKPCRSSQARAAWRTADAQHVTDYQRGGDTAGHAGEQDQGDDLPDRGESAGGANGLTQVTIGTHVQVELINESGDRERLAFDIVPDSEADFSAGFLGAGTPLARALWGQSAGSLVPYGVGDIREVRILAVSASERSPEQAAADRQAVIQKAISQSDLADAVRFALTVDQKWGDTDPEGIAENWE